MSWIFLSCEHWRYFRNLSSTIYTELDAHNSYLQSLYMCLIIFQVKVDLSTAFIPIKVNVTFSLSCLETFTKYSMWNFIVKLIINLNTHSCSINVLHKGFITTLIHKTLCDNCCIWYAAYIIIRIRM